MKYLEVGGLRSSVCEIVFIIDSDGKMVIVSVVRNIFVYSFEFFDWLIGKFMFIFLYFFLNKYNIIMDSNDVINIV